MQEQGRHNLYQAMDRMPVYQAPERIWASINEVLDFDPGTEAMTPSAVELHCALVKANWETASLHNEAVLRRAVNELPQYALPQAVFESVFKDATDNKSRRKVKLWYGSAGIAASIALLVTLVWFTRIGKDSERVRVAYSEEMLYLPDLKLAADSLRPEEEVLAFIRANCTPAVLPCQTAEFKGLLAQYQELEAAKQELQTQIQAHQEQPQLVQYLVRVEKQQTEVGKRLIQYLRI